MRELTVHCTEVHIASIELINFYGTFGFGWKITVHSLTINYTYMFSDGRE